MKVFQKKQSQSLLDIVNSFALLTRNLMRYCLELIQGSIKLLYIEISFDWKECYYINLYRPLIKSILIEYCIKLAWIYDKPKQILRIKDSRKIVQELSLRDNDYK